MEEPLEKENLLSAYAVPLQLAQRDHVMELRKTLGLRNTSDFVESLHREPEALGAVYSDHTAFGRMIVTKEELPRLRHRFRLSTKAPELEAKARQLARKWFGGAVVTAREDGTPMLRLLTTPAGKDALASLPLDLEPELAASIEIGLVEHTEQELADVQQTVTNFLRKLGVREQLNGTTVNVDTNRVEVHLYHPERDFEALTRAELGELPVSWFSDSVRVGPAYAKNELDPYGLVEAGLRIVNTTRAAAGRRDYYCTSGFSVANGYGEFLLTAGHCGDLNDQYQQGGVALGRVANRNYSGAADVMAISTSGTRAAWGRAHLNVNSPNEPVVASVAINGDAVGTLVCHTGYATTGLSGLEGNLSSCGTIRSRQWAPEYIPNVLPVYRHATFAVARGDSGAGVLMHSIYGYIGVGLITGFTAQGQGMYTHLPYALAEMNVEMDSWQ